MKKATIIFFTLMLIFLAACQKNEQQEITTKNSDIHTETAAETSETTTEIPSTENALSDSVQPASTSNIKEVSPYNVVDLDIHKMKAALKAAETMSDEDFENYLISNYPYAHNCEFTTPKKYNEYIESVSEIHLTVVDNDYDNVRPAYYYLGNDNITQIVYTDEPRRFAVDINPLVIFEENDETEFIKSIQTDNFSADIFRSDVWNSYAGNIYCNGETYTFRVYEMDSLDIVESDLSRLSFVKIGDLLNEITE